MKSHVAISHFGSAAALARAVGISKAAVSQWGDLVPLGTAARIEKITQGKLALRLEDYPVPQKESA
jgi:DNA-binding transcriptional regulator YdaS (Cro superfamily)